LPAKQHQRNQEHPRESTGFERLLAAEVGLESMLAEAERDAEAMVRAADQGVSENAQALAEAVERASADMAARVERETAATRARLLGDAARRVATWEAITAEAIEALVGRIVRHVVAPDEAPGGRP
jgi:hypothetical protein